MNCTQGVNNISFYNTDIGPDGAFDEICGWAQPVDPANPTGELEVHFSGASEAKPDWVLDTDYDNFASGYQCQNGNVGSAYIRTRVRTPSIETVCLTFKSETVKLFLWNVISRLKRPLRCLKGSA